VPDNGNTPIQSLHRKINSTRSFSSDGSEPRIAFIRTMCGAERRLPLNCEWQWTLVGDCDNCQQTQRCIRSRVAWQLSWKVEFTANGVSAWICGADILDSLHYALRLVGAAAFRCRTSGGTTREHTSRCWFRRSRLVYDGLDGRGPQGVNRIHNNWRSLRTNVVVSPDQVTECNSTHPLRSVSEGQSRVAAPKYRMPLRLMHNHQYSI
jgi:hypothetical protein